MATQKEDTDPSTPASLRPRLSPDGYGLREVGAREPVPETPDRPTTDPGLGPISRPPPPLSDSPPASGRSRGVVVPPPSGMGPYAVTPAAGTPAPPASATVALSASAALWKDSKDSVELLLDGMAGPRPDRRKTTPRSGGEASASYHAKHDLHPAHTLAEPGPKVVVERPSQIADTAPSAPRRRVQSPGAADTTFVPERRLARRVAMSILAALLIVLAVFVAMSLASPAPRRAAPQGATTTPASLPAAPAVPPPSSVASPAPAPADTASASAPAASPDDHAAKPAPGTNAGSTRRRHRSGPKGDDLGEFKPSF